MKKELLVGIAIGAAALALIAGASVGSLLFEAMILACPLMMLFMGHGAEGGHSGQGDHQAEASSENTVGSKGD